MEDIDRDDTQKKNQPQTTGSIQALTLRHTKSSEVTPRTLR